MFFYLISFILSARFEEFDLYKMAPGNWTHFGKENFSILIFEDDTRQKEANISYFKGFHKENEITLTVYSKTSMIATFQDQQFSLNFSLSLEGVAFAEASLPNGNYVSISGFSRTNFDITIVDKTQSSFIVYGFVKQEKYTAADFIIPTGIAIGIMLFLKYVLGVSLT